MLAVGTVVSALNHRHPGRRQDAYIGSTGWGLTAGVAVKALGGSNQAAFAAFAVGSTLQGVSDDRKRGVSNPGASLFAYGLSGATGVFIARNLTERIPQALSVSVIRSSLLGSRNPLKGTVRNFLNILEGSKELQGLLSRDVIGLGIAAGVTTLTHSIIRKVIDKSTERTKLRDAGVHQGSLQEQIAGKIFPKISNDPGVGAPQSTGINITGSLRSYYNNSPFR